MPDLIEQMYCSQQIKIPPNLPFILKQYAKAAIRTQPYDLLQWSAAYFRAKANNTPPPVKERLEYPPLDTPSRLSPGFLKVLHKQLGDSEFVIDHILHEKWEGVCLDKDALFSMQKLGNMVGRIPWLRFIAVAAGHLCPSLSKTMVLICEVLTEEPEGGSAMIPVDVFINLYEFLARLDCGPEPPGTKTSEESLSDSATTSAAEPSILPSDLKDESGKEEAEVSEKDSTAGLMVWPDLKPEEKPDRVQSPKHTEEMGASSELGIEVLDDAKGPVTELVTIYSAQKQVESDTSVPSPSPIIQLPRFDETILSHSSLEENSDWIKIQSKKGDIFEEKLDAVSPFATAIEASDENPSDDTIQTSGHQSKDEIPLEEPEKQEELSQDDKGTAKLDSSEPLDEPVIHSEPSESKVTSASNKSTPSHEAEQATHKSEHGETSEHPEDAIIPPVEAITLQQFVKEDEDVSVSSSLTEIRKGYFKDKSGFQIERSSSENTVRAAETVLKLEESVGSVNEERGTDGIKKESPSEELKSQDESQESIACDPEVYWQHVPGIGPVIPEAQILAVVEYMNYWASKQHGMVMPRNINHILSPPLDLPPPVED